MDNQLIDERSKSLKGFIDGICNKIEQSNPNTFVKRINIARKDATSKVDILQKTIHYYDVGISNDDISIVFKNLELYLDHIYEEVVRAEILGD